MVSGALDYSSGPTQRGSVGLTSRSSSLVGVLVSFLLSSMAFLNSADWATMFAVDEVFGMLLIGGVCFVGIVLQEDGQSGMYVLRRNLQARKSVPPQSSHQVKLREPRGHVFFTWDA
jgi:hypothetical protein